MTGKGLMKGAAGPVLVVVAVAVTIWLLGGVSVRDLVVFAGYEVAFILLPGCLLYSALVPGGGRLRGLAFGAALGYTLEIAGFALTGALGLREWLPAWPILITAGAVVLLRRRTARDRPEAAVSSAWAWTVAAICSVALVYLALGYFTQFPLPEQVASVTYPSDTLYHLTLAAEAKHHWPVTDPQVSGTPLYTPERQAATAPLVVYFHGGGHVTGDLDTHDQPCRFLARESGALVLAVDYRCAPEHRFPAAVDDALASFRWAHREAEQLGGDPRRIAVAGDSAGGNLAAVVALRAKLDDGPAPAFQALIYPVADYSVRRRSAQLFGEGFYLTQQEMDWFRDHYFATEEDRLDPSGSPLLAPDLSGLAPALVVTAGFDPLRDEGEAYAKRLQEAGVVTTLRREPDLVHGFINAAGLGGRSAEALGAIAADLREALSARLNELGPK